MLRGIEGFGANAHLHTTRLLRLSEDLPILIEVVDEEDRLRAVLPEVDALVGDGLITLERSRSSPTGVPVRGPSQGRDPVANATLTSTRHRVVHRHDHDGDPRTVDVHVRWLRSKIEPDPSSPIRLVTLRGVGYRLDPPDEFTKR